MRLLQT
jgi:SNF2 family DNA or RNA helicase